jgi:hypothetical protein
VGGVELPDEVRINGLDQPLVLNGAGIRKKFFISVYVGALYLTERQAGVGTLLRVPSANRVSMHFVYHKVSKRQLDEAWREGFAKNLSVERLAEVQYRLDRFIALFREMREGDQVWLDFVPGRGTEVVINGVMQDLIPGDDFNLALLSIWLGRQPVTERLKNAMVGVDKG